MTHPPQPVEGFPTLGTVPLGPDEPELFTDAMQRIIRHLNEQPPGARPVTRVAQRSAGQGALGRRIPGRHEQR